MDHRTRLRILILCTVACFAAAPQLFAQAQQTAQQSQQQSQQQANPPQQTQRPSLANPQQNVPAPPPVDPKEEAAYKSFYDMNPSTTADYDAQVQAGESFLKDFPQSRYREAVYSRLTNAYFEKRDLNKMFSAADNALAINPNDLTVLTLVGWVIPHGNPNASNFAQLLDKAEQYEKHALEILSTLTKPAAMTDDEFIKTKSAAASQAHSGLGMVYFRERKFDESSAELEKATDAVPNPDPTDYFVLGIDLESLQRYTDSVKAFDSCSQIQSPLQDRCKEGSAEVKAKEGSAPPKP